MGAKIKNLYLTGQPFPKGQSSWMTSEFWERCVWVMRMNGTPACQPDELDQPCDQTQIQLPGQVPYTPRIKNILVTAWNKEATAPTKNWNGTKPRKNIERTGKRQGHKETEQIKPKFPLWTTLRLTISSGQKN